MSEASEFKIKRQQTVVLSLLVAFVAYIVISYVLPYLELWRRNARERNETMARIEAKHKRCEMFASSQENLEMTTASSTMKGKQLLIGKESRRFDLKCGEEEERQNGNTSSEKTAEGKQARNVSTTTSSSTEIRKTKYSIANVNNDHGSIANDIRPMNITIGSSSSSSSSSSRRRDASTLWREVQHFHPYYYPPGPSHNPWMSPPPSAVSSNLAIELGRERSLRLSQDMEYAAAIAADLQRQESIVTALRRDQELETRQRRKAATWQECLETEPPETVEGVVTIKFQYKLEGNDTANHPLLSARINRRFLPTDLLSSILSFVESHPLCPLNYVSLEISSSYPRINISRSSLEDLGSSGNLTLAELQLTSKCVLYVNIQM